LPLHPDRGTLRTVIEMLSHLVLLIRCRHTVQGERHQRCDSFVHPLVHLHIWPFVQILFSQAFSRVPASPTTLSTQAPPKSNGMPHSQAYGIMRSTRSMTGEPQCRHNRILP
jgi:hypothetical protein